MKLRYYMRGIGICMIVTTLLLGAANDGKETLTDEEIKIRAAQLGMVEEKAIVLSDLREEKENEEAAQTKQETGEETVEEAVSDSRTNAESLEPDESITESTMETVGEAAIENAEADTVTLVIQSGASSSSVSHDLARAGLISDADEYDRYLCTNGYDKVVRMGTYQIPMGSSREEITEIITGKR